MQYNFHLKENRELIFMENILREGILLLVYFSELYTVISNWKVCITFRVSICILFENSPFFSLQHIRRECQVFDLFSDFRTSKGKPDMVQLQQSDNYVRGPHISLNLNH